MEFSGFPQKRSFCGARCRNGVSAETPAIGEGGKARDGEQSRPIGSYNLEIFLPHKKILDIFPSPPYTVKALMRWTISSLG